jgi:LCP family protein required for cell wall assembly
MPAGPAGPQMFAPAQRPGSPVGSGMGAGPSSFAPGLNSFHQVNPGASFSAPGMVAAPPAPGMFNPNWSPMGPGSMGDGPGRRNGFPAPNRGMDGKKRKKKRKFPIWARVLTGVLLFFMILGGTAFAYYQVNFAGSVNTIVGQQVARRAGEANPNTNLTNGILTGPRVNILLLGSDTDQKSVWGNGNYIAQTDIVVTIDPSSGTVGMLSIPRDFYINVPGYGMHKLDEAYGIGGVALSRLTIEQDFGIPINYYAWVGLDGFIKVIDEVGGVDVDVMHPIVDDQYPDDVGKNANNPYAVKRLYIPPGPQHLDGPEALEYVRSRHADLVGDFGRSARQQQVLNALKPKLENPSIFGKLSSIASDLKGYVKTDMQLGDVLKLMNFARGLDVNKINRLILSPPYSSSGKAPAGGNDAGADIVIPDCTKIVPAIAQMFKLGDKAVCNIGSIATPTPVASATGQPGALSSPTASATDQPSDQPSPIVAPTVSSGLPDLGNMAGNTLTGLTSGTSDLFGIRSLLDLLFLGVFESPVAFQG